MTGAHSPLYGEGIISNRTLLILALIVVALVSAGVILVANGDPPGGVEVIPTLAPTASVSLLQTEVTSTSEPMVTETADDPPPTPPPNPTSTPTDTVTWTPTATPSPTETMTPSATPPPSATATTAPTETVTPRPTNTLAPATATTIATATVLPTDTPPPTQSPPPPNTMPELNLIPGEPQAYLNRFRLVTYYGSPLGRALGLLGNHSREQTLRLLRADVAKYQALSPERFVLPGYHMVTTVADPYPPNYRHHVDLGVIDEWVASAKANGVAVVLDIQPGRADLMDEFNRIRYLLYEPHVLLAIDPEFTMDETQIPGVHLGKLYAEQINQIQANMNGIGYEIGLNRVLILHQFADRMLPDKELIQPYPFVELVIDGDGFGSPYVKITNYNQYAGENGFEYGGFKLFPTDGDNPLMSPEYVMSALNPPPVIIIYQ